MKQVHGIENRLLEWSYASTVAYDNPFSDVDLDVLVSGPGNREWRIPAYWAGSDEWRVRFSPPVAGTYRIRTMCTDPTNATLHDVESRFEVVRSSDGRGLMQAPVCRNGRFELPDGKPFHWLGDTWWMGLSDRISWPEGFQRLTADRVEKGYTVIQIVAGLFPDVSPDDPRCANEAGMAWDQERKTVNPAYFDAADLRISWLARSGLVACIVAAWGYYLPILGIEAMKRYWRYLIARWGAYPVVYCLAGEGKMPYYLSQDKPRDADLQQHGWTEVGRYVQEIDPFDRIVTIHPTQVGSEQIDDPSILDFDMLQTGHGGSTIFQMMRMVDEETAKDSGLPVVVAEMNYEGILHDSGPEQQRRQYWLSMLRGAAGYTYGANGLFQFHTEDRPFGPSPHGACWGDVTWEDAYRFEGAAQVGLASRFLRTFDCNSMRPHCEWVESGDVEAGSVPPVAAGVEREFRLIYLYEPILPWGNNQPKVCGIEADVKYKASFWDPRNGVVHDVGIVEPDAEGSWKIPYPPTMSDWLLVFRNSEAR